MPPKYFPIEKLTYKAHLVAYTVSLANKWLQILRAHLFLIEKILNSKFNPVSWGIRSLFRKQINDYGEQMLDSKGVQWTFFLKSCCQIMWCFI